MKLRKKELVAEFAFWSFAALVVGGWAYGTHLSMQTPEMEFRQYADEAPVNYRTNAGVCGNCKPTSP